MHLTFVIHLKFLEENDKNKKGFVLDTGESGLSNNKISIYYLGEKLFFSVVDRNNVEHKVDIRKKDFSDDFGLLIVDFFQTDLKSHMQAKRWDVVLQHTVIDTPVPFDFNPVEKEYFIGASVNATDFGKFEVTEQMVFVRTLNKSEHEELLRYFKAKYKNGVKSRVQFNGASYFYQNRSKDLIQPNKKYAPKFKND